MARNGSGTYSNPYPDFISGTVISSSEVDANNSDIATALTQSIAVDGQAVVTADIPLATHKFTVMKVGTASTDSLSLGQAQAEAFVWCGTAGGSADAITLSPSPAITAYAAGQRFVWMASGSVNTGATTVAISGLSAIALQDNGAALVAGNHEASKMFMGILNTTSTVQIMQVQVSGNDPLVVNSLTVTTDATIGDDLTLLSDSAVLGFGENTDVKITHVHDSGLTLKNTSTGDDTPFVLLVQTGETDIALNDELGKIQFQAPDEAAGTDSRLVAAEISAISEGDFSTSNNATKLSFKTGASEAATEKMSLSSAGVLSLTGSTTDVGGPTYGVYVKDGAVRSTGSTNDNTRYQLIHYNSDTTLCFYVRNDGVISTGVDGNSPYNYTTASATNMYVASNGALYRSTSSLRFKANVEAIENEWADKVLDLEPMFFRSTAPGDSEMPDHWTHYGFAAEQVATIDPRLVEYKTHEFHMEGVDESIELDEPTVEGVQYDRIIPALVNLLKRQRDEIAALTTRVKALEV
jgi:hypothetical protein